jgi:hypothetical protein
MPKLKRVAERQERERTTKFRESQASGAGRILANKKWATKDKTKLKQYLDDLAKARSKRKKRPNKNEREQATLANIQKMRDSATNKKKRKEEKKKDEEVSKIRIAKKNTKKAEAKRKKNTVVSNTALFDEPVLRRGTRTRRKPKK